MNEREAFDFAGLVTRYLHHELSEDEERALMQLIESDEEKRRLLEYYRDTAPVQERLNYMDSLDMEKAWKKINKRSNKSNRSPRNNLKWLLGYAAAFLIAGFLGIMWFWPHQGSGIVADKRYGYQNDVLPGTDQATLTLSDGKQIALGNVAREIQEKDGTRLIGGSGALNYEVSDRIEKSDTLYNTLTVPKAGTYRVVLPDGSRVWVNALSSLRFPVQFDKRERKVFLLGEAYFEVEKNADQPFKVSVNGKEISVLGTSFNVNAYQETVIATLVEGAIKVTNGRDEQFLSPGEQISVDKDHLNVSKADIEKATAWKDGYFYFSHDRIQSIMEQLARWYDLEVSYTGEMSASHFGGSISRQVNLSEVLEMLKDVSGLSFEIHGRRVTVVN